MVDFTRAQVASQVSGPTQTGVPQQGPSAITALASLAQSFVPSKQQMDAVASSKRDAKAASVTELYSQEALKLADAVDMGEMSSGVARARLRRLHSTYIANNPTLQDEIGNTHKLIIGTSGLGQVIDEGTEEERRESAYRDKVYEAGFLKQGMSEEQQGAAIEEYRSFETAKKMLEVETSKMAFANAEIANIRGQIGIQSDRVGLQRAQIGLGNDQVERKIKSLNLEKAQSEYVARQSMAQMSQSFSPTFMRNVEQVLEGLGPNPTPEQRSSAQAQVQAIWSQSYGGVMAGLGSGASTAQVELITKPMRDWMDHANRVIDGSNTLANLQTSSEIAVQNQRFMMLGDPDVAAAAGTLATLGENIALSPAFTALGVKLYKRSLEGNPPAPSDVDYPEFSKLTLSTLDAAANDNLGQQAVEEAKTNLNNLLGKIGTTLTPEATDLDAAADTVSSPQFGAYVEKFGLSGFDGAAREGALATFTEFYVDEIVPLVRQEWQQAELTNPALGMPGAAPRVSRTPSENIRVDFSGAGIRFSPASGGSASQPDGLVRNQVNKLNAEVAPVMNKLVKMGAHLNGHTDYRNFFEQNYRQLFETDVLTDAEG